MAFQRVCAWSGVICAALFFAAFVLGGFVPPLSPSLSPAEVAVHYQSHLGGIRVGVGVMLMSGAFYALFSAVISAQMRRIPGVHHTVIYGQLAAGAFACLTFMVPAMLFATTAFRPDRDPVLTQLLNDLSWIVLVMPWPPFMAQNFSFAFAILCDSRDRPLFPRYLGYLNIWAPITFTPALCLPFFKSGPLAWSGLFVIWIPASLFVVQFIVNARALLRAITDEESTGEALEAGAHVRTR
jgi:hypothetical protein